MTRHCYVGKKEVFPSPWKNSKCETASFLAIFNGEVHVNDPTATTIDRKRNYSLTKF